MWEKVVDSHMANLQLKPMTVYHSKWRNMMRRNRSDSNRDNDDMG